MARTFVPHILEESERNALDQLPCDNTTRATVQKGDTIDFYVDFTAKDTKASIETVNFHFWADKDYNGDEKLPQFYVTKEMEAAKGIVSNQTMRLMTSSKYHIRELPDTPAKDNIVVKYEILYHDVLSDGSLAPEEKRLVECLRIGVKK